MWLHCMHCWTLAQAERKDYMQAWYFSLCMQTWTILACIFRSFISWLNTTFIEFHVLKAEQLNSRDLVQNETPRKWEETGVSHNGPLDIKIPYTPLKRYIFLSASPPQPQQYGQTTRIVRQQHSENRIPWFFRKEYHFNIFVTTGNTTKALEMFLIPFLFFVPERMMRFSSSFCWGLLSLLLAAVPGTRYLAVVHTQVLQPGILPGNVPWYRYR